MKTIKWQGYEWLPQERWGQVHPENPDKWNDPDAIKIDDDETLHLYARKNPKEFNIPVDTPGDAWAGNPPTEKVIATVGFGMMSCTEHFGHGLFEIEAKMPKGPYTWPAFWCWAFETYPPEIDMFEGYSNKRGSYFNWSLRSLIGKFWRVNSNIHLKDYVKGASVGGMNDDGTHRYQLGAKSHWLGWKRPDRVFNKYSLLWTPDEVAILFNDKKVRSITDRPTLDQFKDRTMNIILNNSVQDKYLKTDMPETEFVVKYFKYTPYEDLEDGQL